MTLAEIVDQFPYAGLFLLLVLGGLGLPIPEDATLILCGVLIASRVVDALPALLVVYVTIIAIDFGLYLVGRKFGRLIVTHPRFQRILSPARLGRLEERFRRNGIWIILVGRHLVVLRAQLFLVSGVLRMPTWKFLAADGGSAVVTIALLGGAGYLGYLGGQRIGSGGHPPITWWISGAAVAIIAGIVIYKLVRRRGRRKAEDRRPGGLSSN